MISKLISQIFANIWIYNKMQKKQSLLGLKRSLSLQQSQLNLIFLTDIHLNHTFLEKLALTIAHTEQHFHYCLVGGDIGTLNNAPNASQTQQTPQQIKQITDQTKKVLQTLNDIFQQKVLFIPGNHDPISFLNQKSVLNPEIINIHKKQFLLQNGLSIVGLGGSLPAYSDKQRNNKVWEGFPYNSEEEYEKDLDGLLQGQEESGRNQKIYLIHMGPEVSNTSVQRRQNRTVYSGSRVLNKVLEQKDCLLFLHGHTHGGSRYQCYNGKAIVNPGAFTNGYYAVLKLTRCFKSWNVASVGFQRLF